jgi:hypothetical protein
LNKDFSVLITPLDWGLGHATRCMPIIQEFLKRGCAVSIATSGGALQILKREFPQLTFFELVSYRAEYAKDGRLLSKLFFQSLKFLWAIKKEHQQLNDIIKVKSFDLLVSDNRFGCYSKSIRSIFVTHQINFVFMHSMKWTESFFNYWNRQRIEKFNHCWVPDFSDRSFSGYLSYPHDLSVSFVGILSRFQKSKMKAKKKYDLLALISGPEPQRTIFENIIRVQISILDKKTLIVKGKPEEGEVISKDGLINEVGHLKAGELQLAIEESEYVVCRPGYSSIMDFAVIEKDNIIFVPTPGQPEQEHLAAILKDKNLVFSIDQDNLDLSTDIMESRKYRGLSIQYGPNQLAIAIDKELNLQSTT